MAGARADAVSRIFLEKIVPLWPFGCEEREYKVQQGIQAEDDLIPPAKRSCLSIEEGQIWIGQLFKKKLTGAKAVQKAR